MSVVDLLSLPGVDDPRLSPDGSRLAYVKGTSDWERNRRIGHIWLHDPETGEAFQLTNGEDSETSPRWSPNGAQIAFLADRSDTLETQVHLIRPDGGEARQLTSHATAVSDIQWHPQGDWIYFRAENEKSDAEKAQEEAENSVRAFEEDYRHHHIWRVNVESGEEERVTHGDWSVMAYRLGRSGDDMTYHRAPTPLLDDIKQWEIHVASATGENDRRITNNDVPEFGARLSPDGAQVLFTAGVSADLDFYYNSNLFVTSADGSDTRPRLLLEEMPYEVDGAAWSNDGGKIFFSANTGVRQNLFAVDPDDETRTQLTEGNHSVGDWTYHAGLNRHVFTISTPENPGEVWTLDGGGSPAESPSQVTEVFADVSETYRLPRQELVTYEGRDGTPVEGLLFYPLDYEEGTRFPLVVQTHGGPASSDQFGFGSFWDYPHVLAAMGYVVFQPNYRGSTGYGDAFMRDMVGRYFNESHRDVMAGVDHLIEEGIVDGERMAKMGWSAGGHMTNKIITYTDRFDAAASGAGASNWVSMYSQSDIRVYRTPWFEGTPYEENAPIDVFWENSPLSDVAKVTTPTLFLVGENDNRVPMAQSVEMYRGVEAQGVPTHLYVAPGEPHGWGELRHRLFKANVELAWFDKWVREEPYDWERAPGDSEKETAVPEWVMQPEPASSGESSDGGSSAGS